MISAPPYPLPPMTAALKRFIRLLILAPMNVRLRSLAATVGVRCRSRRLASRWVSRRPRTRPRQPQRRPAPRASLPARLGRRHRRIAARPAAPPRRPADPAAPRARGPSSPPARRPKIMPVSEVRAGHGRRGLHRVPGHQARAVQGPGGLGGAQLPAQAGRHPDQGRGPARRVLGHRRRHERQPGLHRRQADRRHRLRLGVRQGAAGRRHADRDHAGRAQPPPAGDPRAWSRRASW